MFPPTNVNWTLNGEELEEGPVYHLTQVLTSTETTTFNNTVIISDRSLPGEFSCAVRNNRTLTPVVSSLNVTG